MRNILLLVLLLGSLCYTASAQAPVQATVQVNNVKALVSTNGTAFDDGQQGQFIPIQPGLAQKTLVRHTGNLNKI